MQVKKQQLELGMEKWTGSKLGKEYVKVSPYLFNFYAQYIMWNAGLDEAEVNVFWNSLVFYMIQKTPTI